MNCSGVSLALTGTVSHKDLAAVETPNLATAFSLVGNEGAASVIAVGSLIGLTTVIMVLLMASAWCLPSAATACCHDRCQRPAPSAAPPCASPSSAVPWWRFAGSSFTGVDALEEMINIGTLSAFVMVSLGIIVLRRKRPDLKPAFRVPFGPVIPDPFRPCCAPT